MIVSFLLTLVWGAVLIVSSPVRLFNDVTLPSFMENSVSFLHNYIAPLGNFLPLTVIFSCLGFYLVFEGSILTWHGINWIIRRFPTQS